MSARKAGAGRQVAVRPPKTRLTQTPAGENPAKAQVPAGDRSSFSYAKVRTNRHALIGAAEALDQAAKTRAAPFRVDAPLSVGVLALSGQGGSGNIARGCAEALAQAGHQTFLFTGGGFWDQGAAAGYATLPVSAPATPCAPTPERTQALAAELVAHARTCKLDALVVHYAAAGLLEAALMAKDLLAAEGRTLRISATLHGTDVNLWGVDPAHGPALKAQLERCDEVTAVSGWMADRAVAVFGLTRRPRVIPNSIDTEQFNPSVWRLPAHERGAGMDIRRRIAPHGEVVITHVSNLREVKRPLDALEVFAKLRARGQNAVMLLIGDGPLLEKLAERAAELGVDEHIRATGALPPEEVARHLAASDLCLVTSESESFCLAALEAMACGVPVVGSRCGGLEDVMATVDPQQEGRSRLLAPVGDTEAMAEVCAELLADPARYEQVQAQGLRLPFERFPRSRQDLGYLELVEDLRAASP